jgi:DNA-binding winged helix-turn-helix (wHTH) protein/TolB-like protein/Tfp pilus assembly protein PilF
VSDRPQQIYQFGGFRLDAGRRLLTREDGGVVPLSPKLFDTLWHLVLRRGTIVGKDELMSVVWADTIVEENNLNKNISRLRQALGERLGENQFIATIPGKGYQFVADVRDGDAPQPPAQAEPAEEKASILPAPQGVVASVRTGRFRVLTLVIAFALGLSAWVYYSWPRSAAGPADRVRSVAVLPFKPLVPEQRHESLELGMADALIARLGGLEELSVRPLSSVRRYASVDQDSLEACRALNTDAVLEGTIQSSEGRLRISPRLLRCADGKQLWASQFDEPRTDVFAVQDSISERVASALQTKLATQQRRPDDLAAYEAYLNGRFHTLKLTPPEIRKGIRYYEQAIEIDPNYARAFVGLADAYRTIGMVGGLPDAFGKGKEAAHRAISLDDRLAEGHAVLGFITFFYDWDWPAAEKQLRHALQLDPNSPDAHFAYAHLLSSTGRHDEALVAARRASELDPGNPRTVGLELLFLVFAGKTDEAIARQEQAFELSADAWTRHQGMALLYIEQEMYDEAAASGRHAVDASGGNSWARAIEGYALAKSGNTAAARSVLDEIVQGSGAPGFRPYSAALVCAGLGDNGQALMWLERGFEQRDPGMIFLKVDKKWDGLRSDPRFKALMTRMNFD